MASMTITPASERGRTLKSTWLITIYHDGRRYRKRTKGQKSEAKRVALAMLDAITAGETPSDGGREPFSEWAERWLSHRDGMRERGELANGSCIDAETAARDLCAALRAVPMEAITPARAQAALDQVYRLKTRRRGRPVTTRTMQKTYVYFHRIMGYAADMGAIARNPLDKVQKPKPKPAQRRALTAADAAKLTARMEAALESETAAIAAADGYPAIHRASYAVAVLLALATGARIGEILALQWTDFDGAAVSIDKTLERCTRTVKPPKTESGRRRVAIGPRTAATLDAWRETQAAALARIGAKRRESTPICCTSIGTHIDYSNLYEWWKSATRESEFDGLRMHELRHTQATLLLQTSDLKTISKRLGHASANTTMAFYAHTDGEQDALAAADIETFIYAFSEENAQKTPRKDSEPPAKAS